MENKSEKTSPSTSYCSISWGLASPTTREEREEKAQNRDVPWTSHHLWITFKCFLLLCNDQRNEADVGVCFFFFFSLTLFDKEPILKPMSSCPGLLSPQEYNKGALGWFVLISAIVPLTFPERLFFLVQLLLSFLATCAPHLEYWGGNLDSLPCKGYV